MFQLIINMPTAIPTKKALKAFTLPRYSGARYSALTPKAFIKPPPTAPNSKNQKISNTWNFLK
jgi:hypothetical protein